LLLIPRSGEDRRTRQASARRRRRATAFTTPLRSAIAAFPNLIAGPFHGGLHKAFAFAIGACLLAALMSGSRGRRRAERESTIPARRLADGSEPDII